MSVHIKTPLIQSLLVGKGLNAKVWLKLESSQPCGSFKARGVGLACSNARDKGATNLVSSSGGNAGLAVAYSGRKLGMPVTVVVPKTTKKRAIDLIESESARVIVTGENWDEAHAYASELVAKDTAYIHPFDDPDLWEGHSTVIDEISQTDLKPDAIVLSVGGGGLLCGIVEGLKRHGWSDIPIIAVETNGANSLNAAYTANKLVSLDAITSIATSLGSKTIAAKAFELKDQHKIISHLVSDKDTIDACSRFLDDHRILVEPACGASLAAVYQEPDFLREKENILVIVCGGVGVTSQQLQEWLLLLK